MTVFNLGSINIDHFYRLPHLPQPGETLASDAYAMGLGGKGANQSVAALRAGAEVVHIGAIGAGDHWTEAQLTALGLDLAAIARVSTPTGHAMVMTDPAGENTIVLYAGANRAQDAGLIDACLARGGAGDSLLLQNETSHQRIAAMKARSQGMRVFYSAAPFNLTALHDVLGAVSHLLVNAPEAEALIRATGVALGDLPVEAVIVTRGAAGAEWIAGGAEPVFVPAFTVEPVDTTGAGDCFAGALAAGLDRSLPVADAMRWAAAAAAVQVTRPGTAEAMPDRDTVARFLGDRL